jgi:beta-glucosidase
MIPSSRLAWAASVAMALVFASPIPAVRAAQNWNEADNKAGALLHRMTLDEKIGQMTQADLDAVKTLSDIQTYGLGSLLSGGDSDPSNITARGWLKTCKEQQTWALKTRLAIPLLYGIDAVHGHNNVDGAVIFPHNIGLGATHNPALVEAAARVTAQEVAATGMHWTFAPCVAVAQDERWGRTYESFSSSPQLVSELGAAAVRGFQGSSLSSSSPALACAKHFLADGGTQGGIDQGNTVCDEATLRAIHLPGYTAAVQAGVGSVMASYSSWNGRKMHGNKYLLTGLLKGELGFQGFIVSDWAAIDQLTTNYTSAIEQSINAGVDMVMIPTGPHGKNNYADFIIQLKALVQSGKVPQARIDDAVRRILRVKYQMGLFEHPFGSPELVAQVGSAEHRQIARDCVRQSLVLLKNDHQTLPLSKNLKHLHIAGKGANDIGLQCGGWTISWQGHAGPVIHGGTTLLAALHQSLGPEVQISYSANSARAPKADAFLVVVGEPPYAEAKGDRTNLKLSVSDLKIVQEAKASGKPVITVVYSGRPLVLGPALQASDAIVAAWLPGTEGAGIADILTGACSPVGKLPRPWPTANEQLDEIARGSTTVKPLFPIGFGLGY